MHSVSLLLLFLSCTSADFLFEGDNCIVVATRGAGKCINIHRCDYARRLLKKRQNPYFCGFDGKIPLVCCPKNDQLRFRNGTISQKKCVEYHEQRLNPVPAYGKVTKEFPHLAAIGFGEVAALFWLCGGSLISHYFVLAAAHCAHSTHFGPAKYVRLGDLDLKNITVNLNIVQTYIHPEYRIWSRYHDIALFKLDQKVFFDDYVRPACLHTGSSVNVLQVITFLSAGFLIKADLKIIGKETCAERYASDRKLEYGLMDEYQICAGESSQKNMCPGDSDWPLQYRVKEYDGVRQHFVIVGVASFGKGCGTENSVGIYTRVLSYIDWIESIVWSEKE